MCSVMLQCKGNRPVPDIRWQAGKGCHRKETWGFTSTETNKAYLGRGSWRVGNFISNTYSLHCHQQNDCALGWADV